MMMASNDMYIQKSEQSILHDVWDRDSNPDCSGEKQTHYILTLWAIFQLAER